MAKSGAKNDRSRRYGSHGSTKSCENRKSVHGAVVWALDESEEYFCFGLDQAWTTVIYGKRKFLK